MDAEASQHLIANGNDGEYSPLRAKKKNFFNRLSKKLNREFEQGLKPVINNIEKSIEAKVVEIKVKTVEKYKSKKRGLKKYIMRKVLESFVEKDNSEIKKEEPKENNLQAEHPRNDMDSEFTCQYCYDKIALARYEEHIEHCIYREDNNIAQCSYCGGYYKLAEAQEHSQSCAGNVENINIQCEQCNKMTTLKSYPRHLELYHIHGQAVVANSGDKSSQVHSHQLPECAICLLEVKRDGSSFFLECAHEYHTECINEWAKRKRTCPVCMFDF